MLGLKPHLLTRMHSRRKKCQERPHSRWSQRNVERHQFERVIFLGPNECQSSELRFDLGNLPGNSSNEDRLQVSKEMIRIRKYFGESCYHRIKCTITAFLAALMWRRPLNSVFNHYRPQKTKKAAQQDRYLCTGLDDKQVDDENELGRTI